MPIIKSKAKSRTVGGEVPSQTGKIEFDELCCICTRDVPNDALVLRKVESNNIICLFCLVEIALIKQ